MAVDIATFGKLQGTGLQSVGVKIIIKLIGIYLHDLAAHSEFFQKLLIVVDEASRIRGN